MELLRLSGLGGLLGLDGTSVGQFMVSRPLVAGTLTGWLVGDVAGGALVGAILELFLLVSFPTGGSRFPEGSTATVVAVAAGSPFSDPGALPVAVAVGLVWGQLAGGTVTLQRHLNVRLAPEAGEGASREGLAAGHLGAIALDFLRGSAVTGVGVVLGRLVVGAATSVWSLSAAASAGLLLAGGIVSAGILLHDLGGFRKGGIWFATGVALGLVGARLL